MTLTLLQALDAVRLAGARVELDEGGPLLRDGGRVPAPVIAALKAHREGLLAVLALRQFHAAIGFDEADMLLIERALLSGQVNEVRLLVPAPAQAAAA